MRRLIDFLNALRDLALLPVLWGTLTVWLISEIVYRLHTRC